MTETQTIVPRKAFEWVMLAPEDVRFEREGDTLRLTLSDGTHYPRVSLRSCFPVSGGPALLSVRDAASEEQDEIGIIADWSKLAEADRQAVATELELHYFVPKVTAVSKIKDEFGFLYWTVETDKGPKEFVMRNSVVHYAREIAKNHWLIIDVNQARYEIPDVSQLDSRSQGLVSRFLLL